MTQHPIGEMKQENVSDEFFEMLAEPESWHRKALELHRAALLLANQFSLDGQELPRLVQERLANPGQSQEPISCVLSQFFLLSAFAMENLFKGLILFKEPELIKEGRITGILEKHDLLALANRADVSLSDEEQRLCALASSASVSWGRYPTSSRSNASVTSTYLTSASFLLFDSLFRRVVGIYPERSRTRNLRVRTPEGVKILPVQPK